ncbi:MAG TPA: signaling protein, partial [Flavisolibacter sp.]
MKRLLYSVLLTLICVNSFAQEEFVEPSRFLTKFSFLQMTGGVIIMRGLFDKFPDTLNFILDTGSGGISL